MARKAIRRKASQKSPANVEPTVTAVTPPIETGPLGVAKDGAVRAMREELDDARQTIQANVLANERLADEGLLLLRLDPSQIIDEVDTDRTEALGTADEFDELVMDIERRGQKTPVRVRPVDAGWKPNSANPYTSVDTFVLQSGRRRLAACKKLGLKVFAIVTTVTPDDDKRFEDLMERFSENTMRADLTGFEQYLSIGEIAEHMGDLNDRAVGELISLKREEVNVGRSVYKYKAELIEFIGPEITAFSKSKVRPLIKQVKDWIAAGKPERNAVIEEKFKITAKREDGCVSLSNGLQVSAGRTGTLKIEANDGSRVTKVQIDWLLDVIAKGANKVG